MFLNELRVYRSSDGGGRGEKVEQVTDHDDCFPGPIAESDLCDGLKKFPTVPAYWYLSEASIMTSMYFAIVDLLLTELDAVLVYDYCD